MTVRDNLNRFQSIGDGHGNFDAIDSTIPHGFHGGQGALFIGRAHYGDDRELLDFLNDFRMGHKDFPDGGLGESERFCFTASFRFTTTVGLLLNTLTVLAPLAAPLNRARNS